MNGKGSDYDVLDKKVDIFQMSYPMSYDTFQALDQAIAKDCCLAVGFFQRSAVHMMANR